MGRALEKSVAALRAGDFLDCYGVALREQ